MTDRVGEKFSDSCDLMSVIKQDRMLRSVNEIAKKLLSCDADDSFDRVVHECLELVGNTTGQNRVYIWKNLVVDHTVCCVQVYEWVYGAKPIQGVTEYENVPYRILPNFKNALETGKCLNSFIRYLSETEMEILGSQGIKTILIAPIKINGVTWGFIGVDNCESEQLFSETEENMLMMSGFLLANAILKRANDDKTREAEARIQIMFNATPLCCNLWNEKFENIACNDEAVRLFDLSSHQEYIDRFFDLSPEYQPCGTLSAEKAAYYIKKAFGEGYCRFEWRHQKLDGEPVPAEITLVRVEYKDEYIVAGYTRDLRELKANEEKTREAEERIQLMFNATPLGCNMISRDFRIMACNDEAVRMFGLSSQKEYIKRFHELSPEYQPCGTLSGKKAGRYIAEAIREGYIRFEWLHQKLDGEEIPCEVTLVRIRNKNEYVVAGYVRDLREVKAMLREIHTAGEELRAARDEALAHSRAKSEFLAKMSHEIRTPMNAIVGMSELILRERIPPAAKEHAVSIKQASANLLAIINDILDFSKIESGKLELVNEKYTLSSIINDIVNIIRIRVMDCNLLFAINVDANLPDHLIGDEIRLRQIILNVMSNAVKYTKEGHIWLSIAGVAIDSDTVTLKIDVADSGLGIKEEDLQHLFDEFMQFDVSRNKGVEGTGLGLTITKSLCVAMGGDITAASVYGQGSIFTITVSQKIASPEKLTCVEAADSHNVLIYEPREVYLNSLVLTAENLNVRCTGVTNQLDFHDALMKDTYSFVLISSFLYENAKSIMASFGVQPKIAVLAEQGSRFSCPGARVVSLPLYSIPLAKILNGTSDDFGDGSYDGNMFTAPGARILIVDDISTNLKVAEGLMSPYGMCVDTCCSGPEAIEWAGKNSYDIIFMDHMMPGMNGIEATLAIRELPECKTTPIIALTANAVGGVKEMFLSNGFSDFLAKPIEMVKLNEILEKWIPASKKKKHSVGRKDATAPVFKIDGVDVGMGITMTGGSLENYLKVLLVFYRDGLEKAEAVASCLENGDIHLFTIHVHALRSALASIGAAELSEEARVLESAGLDENVLFIQNNSRGFLAGFGKLLDNLEYVVKNLVSAPGGEAVSMSALTERLAVLRRALEEVDGITSNEIINELLGFKLSQKTQVIVDSISQHVLLCEYDEAMELIDRVTEA